MAVWIYLNDIWWLLSVYLIWLFRSISCQVLTVATLAALGPYVVAVQCSPIWLFYVYSSLSSSVPTLATLPALGHHMVDVFLSDLLPCQVPIATLAALDDHLVDSGHVYLTVSLSGSNNRHTGSTGPSRGCCRPTGVRKNQGEPNGTNLYWHFDKTNCWSWTDPYLFLHFVKNC
jgi:hypothetical protein